MGSNPTPGMDVCPRSSVLYCPVYAEAFQWVEPSVKESCQTSNRGFEKLEILKQAKVPRSC
jgi:hypothetical protein